MKKLLCVATLGVILANNTATAVDGLTPVLPGGGTIVNPIQKRLCVEITSIPLGCNTTGLQYDSSCYSDNFGQCGTMAMVIERNGVITTSEHCDVIANNPLDCYVTCSCPIMMETYHCARGYYGTPINGTSGCSPCSTDGVATSNEGATSQTECYIPANTEITDSAGVYIYTNKCWYTN